MQYGKMGKLEQVGITNHNYEKLPGFPENLFFFQMKE